MSALILLGVVCVIATTIAKPRAPTSQAPGAALASIRVVDGDSLRAGEQNIRLIGIDAPERAQTCRDARKREWSCGAAAAERLGALVARGTVTCAPRGRDRYGRTLAVCAAGDVADLGQVMVREGFAVNYADDTHGYVAEESEARAAGRGLWQGAFERPQDWRRRHARAN